MKAGIVLALLVGCAVGLGAQSADGTKTLDLSKAADPIVGYCSPCHGWASDYDSIMASGVITPGDPASSPAWFMISSGRMPAQGPAPTAAEKQLIHDWIAAGAPQSVP